jgi:L-fuconolactonase
MLVDAHTHVWGHELLDAPWLRADAAAGIRRPFGIQQLEHELDLAGVDRAVLVAAEETAAGDRRLLEVASRSERIGAVVGSVDPFAPGAQERVALLRNAPGGELLRGVRVSAVGADAEGWASRDVTTAFAALRDLGLVVEVLADEGALPALAAVGRAVPGLTVVVDHLGGPTPGGLRDCWRTSIRELAAVDGAHLKVSGDAVFAADLPEMLATVGDAFGPSRLMAGSDWPVSTLHGGGAWRRLVEATSPGSRDERALLLGGTAARVYGIAA